jgi:hypothetical protein
LTYYIPIAVYIPAIQGTGTQTSKNTHNEQNQKNPIILHNNLQLFSIFPPEKSGGTAP